MAKIVITLFAVLLAVVYHSYAAPTLNLGLNGVPLPSEGIAGVSAKCNSEIISYYEICEKKGLEAVNKSGISKEILDAKTKGNQTKLTQFTNKAVCCFAWTFSDCIVTDVKNKCDAKDLSVVQEYDKNEKQKFDHEQCKDPPASTKCL